MWLLISSAVTESVQIGHINWKGSAKIRDSNKMINFDHLVDEWHRFPALHHHRRRRHPCCVALELLDVVG